MKLIARKGEKVTRFKSGEYVCTVAEDIPAGGKGGLEQFTNWAGEPPKPGSKIWVRDPDPYIVARNGAKAVCIEGKWRAAPSYFHTGPDEFIAHAKALGMTESSFLQDEPERA